MMKHIITKLFCKHRWISHAKQFYYNRTDSNVEILICEECGKIKQIEY